MSSVDLTTLDGLAQAIHLSDPEAGEIGVFDGTFCPRCGQARRMQLVALFWRDRWAPQSLAHIGQSMQPDAVAAPAEMPAEDHPSPAAYLAACVQCDHWYVLVVHTGPDGLELAALPSSYGGLATPNTKPAVAYYLDQAHRARSVGALSAAAAMYRAALEQLLFHEGFTEGMLGQKIDALVEAENPPDWLRELDPDYLMVIKRLGDGAIHANDGDVEKQKKIDAVVVRAVDALFAEMLDRIYEGPHKRQGRLAEVKEAVESLKREPDGT